MIVIIPIRNQRTNIPYVLSAYLAQSKAPAHIVLVLDRCTDDSKDVAKAFVSKLDVVGCKLHIVEKPDSKEVGFGAGSTRDYGIRYALSEGLEGDFLFSDGDCIPSHFLVEHHTALISSELPRVVCGLRYETIPSTEDATFPLVGDYVMGMPVQADLRTSADYCAGLVFGENYDRLVLNPDVIRNSWVCWSCNMSLNRAAIDLCYAVNGAMDGDENRVFNSAFDGNWGGEDGFVGATVFHCGGEVVTASSKSWVTHIWHERNHTNIEHMKLVLSKELRLIDMAMDNMVPCDPTVYKSNGVYAFDSLDADWFDKIAEIIPNKVQNKVLAAINRPNDEELTVVICLILTGLLKYQGAQAIQTYIGDRELRNQHIHALKWSIKRLRIGVSSAGYFLADNLTEGT